MKTLRRRTATVSAVVSEKGTAAYMAPPDPSYPGAHAEIRAAGAAVLEFFFHSYQFDLTVTSEVLPGVERSFDSFSAAAEEASLSRVFAGVHFRSDEATGQVLGGKIAQFVGDNFMIHVGGPNDESGNN